MCRKLFYLISFILVFVLVSQVSAELVGQWKLDDGSGTIASDATGNGNDGELIGDPQWVDGYFVGCLEFAGSLDKVDIPHSPDLNPEEEFTVSVWAKLDPSGSDYRSPVTSRDDFPQRGYIIYCTPANTWQFWTGNAAGGWDSAGSPPVTLDEWTHVAATYSNGEKKLYINGELAGESNATMPPNTAQVLRIGGGATEGDGNYFFMGKVDDVRVYNQVLSEDDIKASMLNQGGAIVKAYGPAPKNGALVADTWVSISWRAGDFAASHDVYLGENFDDVNEGAGDTFRGNYPDTFYIAGFFGYAYPDGLIPGTTYYWRIDEVNDTEPNSPWKGDIWSFSIPPKTAYEPEPTEGAEFIDLNVQLSWTAGYGAKLHYVVFGEDFDEVNNAAAGTPNGTTKYSPGPLKLAKTYYWRIDEFDGVETYKGDVWSFTTEGAVSGPNPADDAADVKPSVILGWDAGAVAASHEVYFGTDADAVKNATTTSPEYKGAKALGEESFDPGKLMLNTAYYWRIDEVNDVNPDSPWAGNVWSFTTGDFFVIDDFEDYNAGDNQIWFSWHDGLGAGAPGTPGYIPGNGTGSAVGDETTASYTEETIVHGGSQSMPVSYDNNQQGIAKYSEVELTLVDQRDWTEEGVTELSLWFRGNPASVGSFVEGPVGTYTMTASGADIWNQADEFHLAYKILTGPGSIVARIESVEQTDVWAKAGVMIRETLDAGSKFAAVYITPTNTDGTATNGCRFQARTDTDASATSDSSVATTEQTAIIAPYWVKLERDVGGNFRGYYSSNGSTWQSMSWNPQSISMSSNVYVGLALTSHNAGATCQAKFSNVTITGTVGPQWANQDLGIESNAAEPLYVALSNSAGTPAVVVHDDPAAATIDTWTQWVIPLQALADQGIVLTDVDRIAIGLGTQGNMTIPGGAGKMYIDDIRLLKLAPEPELQP